MKLNVAALTTTSLLLLAAMATGAGAEALPDPTRPPEMLESAAGGGEQAPAGLQSIIRREGGRPAAIINGEYVVLGGLVGDAKLVNIGEDFVTLKGPEGTETLHLLPGIEKTPASVAEGKGAAPAPDKKKVKK